MVLVIPACPVSGGEWARLIRRAVGPLTNTSDTPMFNRILKKQSATKLKEVQIGDGNLTIDLPFHLQIDREEDNTTVVRDPAFDGAIMRFSTLYTYDKRNPDASAATNLLLFTRMAKEQGRKLKRINNKVFYTYSEPSQQGDEAAKTHFWIIAFDNAIVIASCWLRQTTQNALPARILLESMEAAIRSLRLSRILYYEAEDEFHQEKLPLSPEHMKALDQWRQAAYAIARSKGRRFLGTDNDLVTLQTVLNSGAIEKTDTVGLEGLGVVFGDILAKKLDLHWITVSDNRGIMPALQYRDSDILLFAKDMIVKRIKRGEEVNVVELFNALVEYIRKMIASGDYSK